MTKTTYLQFAVWTLCLSLCSLVTSALGQTRFSDDFEHGLKGWELYGEGGVFVMKTIDSTHGSVLVLRPQGDVFALVKGSEKWGGKQIEGDALFPSELDNYFGVVYNFHRRGRRTDFGLIYIKGNENYLTVNPHRDFNVGRTLYSEYTTTLKGSAAIQKNVWTRFKVEVIGSTCHFYVGNMEVPQLTFSELELSSGEIGLQPRSVGEDVWVDNIRVSSIKAFSYTGPAKPDGLTYDTDSLLTKWEVIGPLERTNDAVAQKYKNRINKWRPFPTDRRGAVITAQVVDYHGPNTVAYFRTTFSVQNAGEVFLNISTVDDLALWVNGRFQWFIPKGNLAWYDFWKNPEHKGRLIPLSAAAGKNEIVLRVRGGVYASGGFFARIEQ
jgi:hypothetical protein